MSKCIKQIMEECELRGLSPKTKTAYVQSMEQFLRFFEGKDPERLGIKEIKQFLLYLSVEKKLQGRSVNRIASGIKFYYFKVLERNWRTSLIPRRKEKKTVPMVLSKQEISKMIHCLRNVKHKAVLMTLYATGIRNDEIRNLKASDIDSKRMVIHIRGGKGNVDREAILSPRLLEFLRFYWRENKDDKSNYLFVASKNSRDPKNLNKKLSHTSVGYMVKNAARISGIKKKSILTP